jgi:hypothetical protein
MEEPKPDKNGNIRIRLNPDDSALIVRADGTVEVVSREMAESENGYVGDVEDLNKTFSLVLALAASLEDESLYAMIYNNLNTVLMRQWDKLDDEKKKEITEIRQRKDDEQNEEEREEKDKRVDEFRDRMNRHRKGYYEDQQKRMMRDLHDEAEAEFMRRHGREFSRPKKKGIKKRKPSLSSLKNVKWNPYDATLKANFKDYRADTPPDEEE